MFCSTVIHGNTYCSWNTIELSGWRRFACCSARFPDVCSSRPARILISVDLPQPDGPTMQQNSPVGIERLRSATAGTTPCFDVNVFDSPSRRIFTLGDPQRLQRVEPHDLLV